MTLAVTDLPLEALAPAERLALLPPDERRTLLGKLTEREARSLAYDWQFWGRPDQHPPDDDWSIWAVIAGRGVGKTRTGTEWVRKKASTRPKGATRGVGVLIGADAADVRDLMVEGPSGILTCSPPGERPKYEPSKRLLTWPTGMRAYCRSGEDPESIRGINAEWAWCDELAKWRYIRESWDQLRFALREGAHPETVITTTPKPAALLKEIVAHRYPGTIVAPKMSTYRNRANLAPAFLEEMDILYAGTRLGRQELEAEILEDVEGALWTLALIDQDRLAWTPDPASGVLSPPALPEMDRTVVAVDPSGTRRGAECGIVVVGKAGRHAFVLDDRSKQASPADWAATALTAYQDWHADAIVAEVNFGADMVENTIKTVPATDRHPAGNIPRFITVRASLNKKARAEPVVGLYENHFVHHVGHFADLEGQMTTWVPDEIPAPPSPDRLDALVWGVTHLLLGRDLSLAAALSPGGSKGESYWKG